MGILDNDDVKKPVGQAPNTVKSNNITDEEIESWFNYEESNRLICMVLGIDGTGKSGLVMDHIAKKLRENPESRALVIDLDDGCGPLLKHHKDVANRIAIKNPRIIETENDETEIKYLKTMEWIKETCNVVSKNYKRFKIDYIVFDGLSTLLKYCERQMRLEKHLDVDGGVQLRMWLKRNKDFEDTLEIIKSVPVNTFYIGHEDFVLTEDAASIKIKTNAMMWQRVHCSKIEEPNGDYKMVAHITKSKSNIMKENTKLVFAKVEVNPETKQKSFKFDSTKVFEGF